MCSVHNKQMWHKCVALCGSIHHAVSRVTRDQVLKVVTDHLRMLSFVPLAHKHPLVAVKDANTLLVYLYQEHVAGLAQVKTTRTFLRDCTVVSPMALLLFGGALAVQHEAGLVRKHTSVGRLHVGRDLRVQGCQRSLAPQHRHKERPAQYHVSGTKLYMLLPVLSRQTIRRSMRWTVM